MPEQEKRQGESEAYFGSHRLDLVRSRLWHGKQEVRVTGKAFAVLCYFVEHPGQLVSKDDLFAAVWPDTVVSDATLASCIQDLRQALGDKAKKPRYIETVHGRGYRFIGEVARSQQEESQKANGKNQKAKVEESGTGIETESILDEALRPSSEQASAGMTPPPSIAQDHPLSPQPDQPLDTPTPTTQRSWSVWRLVFLSLGLLVGVIVAVQYFSLPLPSTQPLAPNPQSALPLPDKPSLIVLPLVNLSGDSEQEYFSDGLTDVLTGKLSSIASLFVIARNSAFTYKGKATKVQDISREMGVRYVLEGSVQKANQRVRVNVQLIDATTGYHVWSEQYDRPLKDIFALQDEIVQKIATTLKLQLSLEEQGVIVRKHTDKLEAYDYVLRGVEYNYRYTQEANSQARQMFEKALLLDPQYAEAYTALGWSYQNAWVWGFNADPQTQERARALAQQALALDNSQPSAHSLLCVIYAQRQQYDQAIAEGERAIALDPNNADSYVYYADALTRAGRPEEARREVEQAMQLNPRFPSWYSVELGWACSLTGRYAEAITTLKEGVGRNPNDMTAYNNLAWSYLGQWFSQQSADAQQLELALAAAQRSLALSEAWHWPHITSGSIYLYQQRYEQALVELERAVALAPTEGWTYAGLALVLGTMGKTEETLKTAAQALALKSEAVDNHLFNVGTAYVMTGHYEEAREPLQRFLSHYPNLLPAHLMLAAAYSELGQAAEARSEVAEVLRLNPNFSLEVHKQRMPIKDPAMLERHIAALRKAGLK